MQGNVDTADAMLKTDPQLMQTQVLYDKRMQSAPPGQYGDLLTLAVAACNPDMISMLINNGMPADGVLRGEALTLALLADSPDMAEILLRAGASPDPQKLGGKNILFEVTAFGAAGAVQTLLRYRLDTNWVDAKGNDHLDTALSMQQYEIAEHLIKSGAKLWRVNSGGALSAWQLNQPAIMELSRENEAARERLLTMAKAQSSQMAMDWPPPAPDKVRPLIIAKTWPTAAMAKHGMVISKEALADIIAEEAYSSGK